MALEDAFLQAIIQNPADDMPRLVYSNWLEQNGDLERAEFIRIQCQLARMSKDDPTYSVLELRQFHLFRWHGWQWWYQSLDPNARKPTFCRGFVDELELETSYFLQHSEGLFRSYPLLKRLILRYLQEGNIAPLLAVPEINRLDSLQLYASGRITTEAREALVRRFGTRIRCLNWSGEVLLQPGTGVFRRWFSSFLPRRK